jgi:hypothetical protein
MAIKFHCEHCGKKIEAPNNAGGKWGKCPKCHNKVYVPNVDAGEELKLAPVDKSDEERRKELMYETYKLTQEILLERKSPDGPTEPITSTSDITDKQLTDNLIAYLRQMADRNLDQAETVFEMIIPCSNRAVEILDRIALSELPEEPLADVPQQVLSGLIRDLRNRLI